MLAVKNRKRRISPFRTGRQLASWRIASARCAVNGGRLRVVSFEPWASDERVLSEPALAEDPWADYFDQLFPVRTTNPWGAFKIATTGRNHVIALWTRRAEVFQIHSLVHGDDPSHWPLRHPTLVLHVPEIHYAACLGCTWLAAGTPDRASAEVATNTHPSA